MCSSRICQISAADGSPAKPAGILFPRAKDGFGIYASKSRSDFPGEEIRLDSLLALRSAEPCPLVAHTDFSAYIPNLRKKKKCVEPVWLIGEGNQRRIQGGWPPWPEDEIREGDRERSKRAVRDVCVEVTLGFILFPQARAWVRKSIDD